MADQDYELACNSLLDELIVTFRKRMLEGPKLFPTVNFDRVGIIVAASFVKTIIEHYEMAARRTDEVAASRTGEVEVSIPSIGGTYTNFTDVVVALLLKGTTSRKEAPWKD